MATEKATTIRVSARSRYRTTPLFLERYEVEDGSEVETRSRLFYGTWEPPTIYETRQPTIWKVAADEAGRPDLLAYRLYKDPTLWWAVCLRNNVFFPLIDLRAGMTVICPHIEDVMSALTTSRRTIT